MSTTYQAKLIQGFHSSELKLSFDDAEKLPNVEVHAYIDDTDFIIGIERLVTEGHVDITHEIPLEPTPALEEISTDYNILISTFLVVESY